MALPAGFPPASFRLEDGCLMYSTTAAIQNWSEWQDFHLRPPGPKPGALKTELHSEKNGGPEGTCTLSLPADNGLLCQLSYESEMVGSGGNAPLVTSDFLLRHWFYRPAAGTLPLKLVAGVGVTPT